MNFFCYAILLIGLLFPYSGHTQADVPAAPDRNEGEGPFEKLIIRGVTLIDGTGSPPIGPVDIVVEGNRITRIEVVGYPGVPINDNRRPVADKIEEMA